jgi:glycosyltransferase involved in cell wall biosynthesis
MRILYHHRTLGDGAEGIHVAEIVKAFRQLGHDVRVLSLIGEATNTTSKAQSRWARLARLMPGFVYEFGEMAYNLHGYVSLSRAVQEFRPDFIYDRYVSYNYSAVGTGRRYGLPVILEVNSPYSFQKQTFDETLYFKHVLRFFERRICRDATRVVVVSTPLKKFLVSIGVPTERIVVMPNGTDPDVFHPDIDGQPIRQQYGLEGKIVIGFCGILRPWHGLELLIQAFAEAVQSRTDLHLLIVGDGPIRAEFEGLLRDRGLDRYVTITGRQPHERVRLFVAAMDIAVSPRATFYASPMKILEYMGMAKAIVAPDMENIRDILTHMHDGLLFRAEDAGSLAKSLQYLIGDAARRARLGQTARRKIEAQRTWLHNAQEVIRLVEKDCHTS